MNTTIIRTVKGKSIMIQHDTTSPRPSYRPFVVQGTKGIVIKQPDEKIAVEPDSHAFFSVENKDKIFKQYEHPLIKYIGEKAREVGGHGGMDYIMQWRLIYCLRNGFPLDQSVYDAASWSCLVELTEKSVLNNSQSVKVPDFTRGEWREQTPVPIIDMEKVFHV